MADVQLQRAYFKRLVRVALCTKKHSSNMLVVRLLSSTQTINKLVSVAYVQVQKTYFRHVGSGSCLGTDSMIRYFGSVARL